MHAAHTKERTCSIKSGRKVGFYPTAPLGVSLSVKRGQKNQPWFNVNSFIKKKATSHIWLNGAICYVRSFMSRRITLSNIYKGNHPTAMVTSFYKIVHQKINIITQ